MLLLLREMYNERRKKLLRLASLMLTTVLISLLCGVTDGPISIAALESCAYEPRGGAEQHQERAVGDR